MGDPKLVDAANHDYHLLAGSPCAEAGVAPGMGDSQSLTPALQYVHPASFETRTTVGTIDIGAYELGGGSTGSGGGAATTSAGAGTGSASTGTGSGSASTGGSGTGGSGGEAPGSFDEATGCGCSVIGNDGPGRGAAALLVLAAALTARRRRLAR
jgi:MYXO-CTERM domain-containing protein